MNRLLRTFSLASVALLGMSAFAQPLPPYQVTITGTVVGCNSPGGSVVISTTPETLPEMIDIEVPLNANCGWSVTWPMMSYSGGFIASTACGPTVANTTGQYIVDVLGNATVPMSIDCNATSSCAACFTFSQGTSPFTAALLNCSTMGSAPFTFTWTFPDGTSSTAASPTHDFGSVGQYDVCLTVADANGCSSTSCEVVYVDFIGGIHATPINDDTQGTTYVDMNSPCTTNTGNLATADQTLPPISCGGSMSSVANDVWFGFIATASSSTVTVDGDGDLDLVLEVFEGDPVTPPFTSLACSNVNAGGGQESTTVNTTPGEHYLYRVYYMSPTPSIFSFNTCVSEGASPDCEGVSGGAALPGTPCTVPGTILEGTWSGDCICEANSAACDACFTAQTNTPWSISFDNCSTGPSAPFAYNWMFSDGTISTMEEPTWNISLPGLYSPCLTISDMNGCTSTVCDTIFVDASGYIIPTPPMCAGCITVAASTTEPNGGGDPIPYSVDLSNCASGGTAPYTYSWSFGDGTGSTVADPGAHVYAQPGSYPVCLVTTDANGISCLACDSVYVLVDGTIFFPNTNACNAEFFVMQAYEWVADPANPNGGGGQPIPNELWLWNLSACGNGNCQFLWSFGDGTSSTEAYPSHTYGSSGTYELCLTINDNGVCTSSICHNITVDNDGILDGLMGQGNRSTFRIRVMDPLSVGVTELPTFSGVSAWPNPVNDILNLTLDSRTQGKVNATITDLSGRMVLTTSLGINGGSNRLTVPVTDLNAGLYMITISNGSTAVTERFVKVH